MAARPGVDLAFSRRTLLVLPAAFHARPFAVAGQDRHGDDEDREVIGAVRRDDGFVASLTLGLARVVLRPGAATWAATPAGARLIAVEAGVLGVVAEASAHAPVTAAELAAIKAPPSPDEEVIMATGTVMTFAARGVASLRNVGPRPAVILDAAIYHEEPRPVSRAFTADGVSFQLLANASADATPAGPAAVTLERVRLERAAVLPGDLSAGLTLIYLEAGTLQLTARGGSVAIARAAAAAPYAMPGALEALDRGEARDVTAGGVVFLPVDGDAIMSNIGTRAVEMLALTVREAA